MTTTTAPVRATQLRRLTFAEQRAGILGVRAGMADASVSYCDSHGRIGDDGYPIKRSILGGSLECGRGCDWASSFFPGDYLDEELHQLQNDDRRHGTRLRPVAEAMRLATRREIQDQREERDYDRRCRGEG